MASPASNPPLFPPWVGQHTVTFEVTHSGHLATEFPGVPLPESLARAVRKRQVEFLAGRSCAREALRSCAPEVADAVVGIGPRREPLWPPGVVGTITHTHGYASAAVARATNARAIGLDAERVLTAERAANVRGPIAPPGEVEAIADATGWPFATALTAIFSAKETIFKTLYPEVNRYFDFHDAWLDAFDLGARTFRAHLVTALTPALPAGHSLAGTFGFVAHADASILCTAIVLPA